MKNLLAAAAIAVVASASTVSVRRGDFVFTHDSRGRHVSTQ